jgi:hypothetical protein
MRRRRYPANYDLARSFTSGLHTKEQFAAGIDMSKPCVGGRDGALAYVDVGADVVSFERVANPLTISTLAWSGTLNARGRLSVRWKENE